MKRIQLTLISIFFFLSVFCQNTLNEAQLKIVKSTLDRVLIDDQCYRSQLDSIEVTFGSESIELKEMWKKIHILDSVNLKKVKNILDQYGWIGSDKIGEDRNEALFMVIQHSNKKTMEYYLPILKEAYLQGNASAKHYAMLQDRVEMLNCRPQIFGTQIQFRSGVYFLYKVVDEPNLNKRRKEIGLNTIEEYLKKFNIEYAPTLQ